MSDAARASRFQALIGWIASWWATFDVLRDSQARADLREAAKWRFVRYDGNFELAWLRPDERVMSAGDGSRAAIIVSADGSERRVNVGDEIEVPA